MRSEDVILSQTFRTLLPPHPGIVLKLIHDDIKEKREVQPGIAWKGILVDGYVRYDICKELGIPFEITEMEFTSEEEAKFFKISNQLLQRDITVFQRCEIIYPFEKFIAKSVENQRRKAISKYRQSGETTAERQGSQDNETASIIAGYAKTSTRMWYRAKVLIEKADEEAKELLRTGKLKIYPTYLRLQAGEPLIPKATSSEDYDVDIDNDGNDDLDSEAAIVTEKHVESASQSNKPIIMRASTQAEDKAGTTPKHKIDDGCRVTEAFESDDGNIEVANTDDDIGFWRESTSSVMSTQKHSNYSAEDTDTGFPRACNIHFNMGAPLDAELEAELAAEEKLAASTGSTDSDASDDEDWSTDDVDIEHDPYISEIDINNPDTHLPEVVPNFPEMPKRNPIPFPLVRQQVQYSVQTMLFELLVGLCGLRDDDLNRRDEILEIVKYGFKKAKKLIERETNR